MTTPYRAPKHKIEEIVRYLPGTLEDILKNCKRTQSGCLEWQGYRNIRGYGTVKVLNKKMWVHRIVLWDKLGRDINVLDPSSGDTLHSCDNPPCCEKDHLSLGTRSQNIRDAIDRGLKPTPRPRRRFSNTQVEQMRQLREDGKSYVFLQKMFNADRHTLYRIVTKELYKELYDDN